MIRDTDYFHKRRVGMLQTSWRIFVCGMSDESRLDDSNPADFGLRGRIVERRKSVLRVNVTIPVFNEAAQLASSVAAVIKFLAGLGGFLFEVVIADNGSTDGTAEIAHGLAVRFSRVRVKHLKEKGRGRALRQAWIESEADILSYMDVDLSTDLEAFPSLIGVLTRGEADLAVGSRLLAASVVRRGWRRDRISRVYNRLIRLVFGTRFSDAQCGFKAITSTARTALLPVVKDNDWFFDTELLVLAEKRGFRIRDIPVRWTDDSDSRVKIVRTIVEDLRGLWRLRRAMNGRGIK